VKPAASRNAFNCAPNDPGAPVFITPSSYCCDRTGAVRFLCGYCPWSQGPRHFRLRT
jgi:hypothetical protein